MTRGFHHVGLVTKDMDATIDFYTRVLDFKVVRYDRVTIEEGGVMRHAFLDAGHDQMLAFLEPKGVDRISDDIDTGINNAIGTPIVFYHFAFHAVSTEWLLEMRDRLMVNGIPVSDLIDHEWCHSISFEDPVNKLQLEFCTTVRELNDEDAELKDRFTASVRKLDQRGIESRTSYREPGHADAPTGS